MTPDPKAAVGATKLPLGLIPPSFKVQLSLALAFGARKYGKASWLDAGNEPVKASTYVDAMHRHLDAWASGEDSAEDSGVDHLAHLAASCAILLDARAAGRFRDDRTNVEHGVMATGRFVSYCRVSTARQGASGLGLEAQRDAIRSYLNGGQWSLVAEVVEIESGTRSDRPKLAEALRLCKVHGATLIIGKLDRLARNVAFVSSLMEAGVEFTACDFPQANRLTIHILAAVAEHEAAMISARTKAALAAAKARGTKLGGFRGKTFTEADHAAAKQARTAAAVARGADLAQTVREMQATGATTLGSLAKALTAAGIETARGKATWSPMQVSRLLATMEG